MKIRKEVTNEIIMFSLGGLLGALTCILAFRNFLFSSGLVIYGDFYWEYSEKIYPGFYAWNDIYEVPNIINQLIVRSFYYLFPPETAQRLLIISIFIIMGASSFFSTYKLLSNKKITTKRSIIVSSIIASEFFMLNPITAIRLSHVFLLWYYSFLPLLFYFTYDTFTKLNSLKLPTIIRRCILISLLLFAMSPSIRVPFYISLFLFTIIMCVHKPYFMYLKRMLVAVIIVFAFFFLFSSIWLLPMSISSKLGPVHYEVTEEVLRLLSRNANLFNVFTLSSFWGVQQFNSVFNIYFIDKLQWRFILALIAIYAFSSILLSRKKAIVILAFYALIMIFLAKGINPPFGDFYELLVLYTPFNIGWQFRGPNKWNLLIAFSYAMLIGFTTYDILIRLNGYKKHIKRILSIFIAMSIVLLYSIANYPFLTGDLNGNFTPMIIPEDFWKLDSFLQSDKSYYRVIFYPYEPSWGSPKPTIDVPGPSVVNIYLYTYLKFIIEGIRTNKTFNAGKLLSPLNIKYFIINKEEALNSMDKDSFNKFINCLNMQRDLKFVNTFGKYLVFKNTNKISHLYIADLGIGLIGFDALYMLSNSDLINLSNSWILPLDYNAELSRKLLNNIDIIINPSLFDFVFLLANNKIVIGPAKYVSHYNPQKYWSKTSSWEKLHAEWHKYLEKLGYNNWDLDYGYGIVFTQAKYHLVNIIPAETDLILSWDFSSIKEFNAWKEINPIKQFNAIQRLLRINNILRVELYNSTKGWKIIKSPLINVSRNTKGLLFRIKIRGINAHKVHIKVLEYDNRRNIISIERMVAVGDGIFDWKEVSFPYIIKNSSTNYIQIQIWHGSKTDKPLPNIIELDYVKVYDVTKYLRYNSLEITFNTNENGYYIVLIRLFKNINGGLLNILIDDHLFSIDTKSDINKFVWINLGEIYLNKSLHKIRIENVQGLNAINVIAIIPQCEFNNILDRIPSILQNKTIVYTFDINDQYIDYSSGSTLRSMQENRFITLTYYNKLLQYSIDIIKPGYYLLVIRGIGPLNIIINESTCYRVYLKDLNNYLYIGPIYFNKGTYKLRLSQTYRSNTSREIIPCKILYEEIGTNITEENVLSKSAYHQTNLLKSLWIYSIDYDNSKSLDEILNQTMKHQEYRSYTINFKRESPVLWKVQIKTSQPFMLVLAESYDSLWEAKVYKNGELIGTMKPIPVYGIINGFWINATGHLEIIISYKSQEWIMLGLIISIISISSAIIFLLKDYLSRVFSSFRKT